MLSRAEERNVEIEKDYEDVAEKLNELLDEKEDLEESNCLACNLS